MAFTDTNISQNWGKTGIPALTAAIDANFALIESGGAGAITVDSLICTAGATFGGGAGATGVTIGTTGTLTVDGIVQINDNVNLQLEGVAADLDGLIIVCDNAGDSLINSTAGNLTLTTSDGEIVTGSRIIMGAQGTGVTINTADPFGLEVHSQHASDVVSGATGRSCGIRSRYEISVAQTTQISLSAVEARLRVKAGIAEIGRASCRERV